MPSLEYEVAALAMADRHIAQGRARIAAQSLMIEGLRSEGHDTALAEALLAQMELALTTWGQHRDLIGSEIDRLGGNVQ